MLFFSLTTQFKFHEKINEKLLNYYQLWIVIEIFIIDLAENL